ncbi:MAG: hypothetical protein QNL87_02075 [Gammaproteobacteria bacterium]|nr:hypothetical protein [Gammaproteobacteria bacterium]
MKASIFATVAMPAMLISPGYADDARPLYNWMKGLEGKWTLSPADQQEGKATKHPLVAPLVGTDATGISFELIGKQSTVQENLLPGTNKEMVTMYHCQDVSCSQVKATHYCVKQNQPEMLADLSSAGNELVYHCDMSTGICKSSQDHVHTITHELSPDGKHLETTYTSWKDGKYLKDSVYHFDRK